MGQSVVTYRVAHGLVRSARKPSRWAKIEKKLFLLPPCTFCSVLLITMVLSADAAKRVGGCCGLIHIGLALFTIIYGLYVNCCRSLLLMAYPDGLLDPPYVNMHYMRVQLRSLTRSAPTSPRFAPSPPQDGGTDRVQTRGGKSEW